MDLQPVLPEYPYDYPYLVTMLAPLWPLDNCGVQPTDKLYTIYTEQWRTCLHRIFMPDIWQHGIYYSNGRGDMLAQENIFLRMKLYEKNEENIHKGKAETN